MKTQSQSSPLAQVVPRFKQPVLNHSRGRPYQTKGVTMVATVVAGHIQCTQQMAIGGVNGGCGTGQETIALKKMLIGVHNQRTIVRKCRANRIRTAVLLMPCGTRAQRDSLGTVHKLRVS